MRKRIILGDMHGRFDVVHKIYDYEQPDDVIMLGDYVDTHENISDEDQHDALKKLIRLQFNHINDKKGEFILLMGNHDFHYFYGNPMCEQYSGYSYHRAEWAPKIFEDLIKCNQMQMVYRDVINKTVYSHAGISNTWLKINNVDFFNINNYIKDSGGHEVFRFTYGAHTISNTGNAPENSCIWIRPYSLLNDLYTDDNGIMWTQIVGHTPCRTSVVCLDPNIEGTADPKEAKLILNDILPKQYIVEWLNDDGTLYSREAVDNINNTTHLEFV